MIFSSLLFLFRFLPATLLLYYIVPRGGRNLILLLTSLVFYAWGEPVYLFLMLTSILISYLGGFFVDLNLRRGKVRGAKIALSLSVAAGLSLLAFFKYADFAVDTFNRLSGMKIPLPQIALPIGISFYTFQTISYIIDVYRGSARVQKNPVSYGAYVTMFPQLIAGPIVQYKTIDRQLRSRTESAGEFAQGIHRFMTGLGKKVLLANNAGALWEPIRQAASGNLPAATAWLGIAAYTFQIYFDFSAYSDMAIGLGHMFGFTFLENFRYPYESKSVTEFWRRWHISLGTWFREYVYIPLGGNRKGTVRWIRNILIVWLLTGIWHGANWNFLFWGLYYGLLLIVEKRFLSRSMQRWPAWAAHVYTMILVMLGWFLFDIPDIASPRGFFLSLFGKNGLADAQTVYYLYNNAVLLAALLIGSSSLPARLAGRLMDRLKDHDIWCILLKSGFYLIIFLLSTAFLVNASYNPFLYFRF